MPYIKQYMRDELFDDIDDLVIQIRETATTLKDVPGVLNYTITKLLKDTYGVPVAANYRDLNEIIGVLECCKLEFYRAFAVPYEDKKRLENGDV